MSQRTRKLAIVNSHPPSEPERSADDLFSDGSIRRVREPSSTHNNSELLLWSLFLCEGGHQWVDVERWFVKAWELSPERLSWRTMAHYPDYKKCSKALQELEDPKRSDHLGLVARKDKYTRKLTLAGVDWCGRWEALLRSMYSSGQIPQAQTTFESKLLPAARKSEVFRRFLEAPDAEIQVWEMADLLRCQPESKLAIWLERCDSLEAAARRANDSEFIDFCATLRTNILNRKQGN
jgi:hypothetical protein